MKLSGLRRFFPPNGRPYELFDCSVLLFSLFFIGYVLTSPSDNSAEALSGLFAFLPEEVWGATATSAAIYGIFASYNPRLVTSGYQVTIVASWFWGAALFVGMFTSTVPIRVLLLVMLYGWVGRRLYREEDRDYYYMPN